MNAKLAFVRDTRMYRTVAEDFGAEKAETWAETWEEIKPAVPFLPTVYKPSARTVQMEDEMYPKFNKEIPASEWGTITPGWER